MSHLTRTRIRTAGTAQTASPRPVHGRLLSALERCSGNREYHNHWQYRQLGHALIRARRLTTPTWRGSRIPTLASNLPGFATGTPAATNGPVSRVATVNPCTAAMAAIWPSAIEIACPAARARLMSPAYIAAACRSNGRTRAPKSVVSSSLSAAASPTLRFPSGRTSTPRSNSERLIEVRYKVSAICSSSHACTPR